MSEDKFDVIIVGGGPAGSAAAYELAKAGLAVIVIERGTVCGEKNMTGGRLYGHSLKKIIPDFEERAPLERKITKERISLVTDGGMTTVEYSGDTLGGENASYSVLRSKFDAWLAEEAEAQGAEYINGINVDDLIVRNGIVKGIIAGEDRLESDVVILADGVNSLLAQKIGMCKPLDPMEVAVGAKEVITLGEEKIRERFGLTGDNGAAWLFVGTPTGGNMGGGFLYTNKSSISLGIVTTIGDIDYSGLSVVEMLDGFKAHPAIAPVIEGGELAEYSGHMVPEGGYDMIPELYGNGVLVAGDAAALVINLGYMVRGMDLAIESGRQAAAAVLYAKRKDDFSRKTLAVYRTALENSFVLRDMKQYRKAPEFMSNRRIFNKYPAVAEDLMRSMFTIDGSPAGSLVMKVLPVVNDLGLGTLAKDGITIVESL